MLKVHELSAFYGKVEVLKGISLQVHDQEIVALIGANGAGKTTTLRAISGLVKSVGEIEFLGQTIGRQAPEVIVKMGISHVPEGGGVFPDMTVLENLELGACTRTDKQAIEKDIQKVFQHFPILADRKGQMAGTLSGGERQMLAMGRGLMAEPKLYLLDEPSLGLSPLMVKELARIIAEINQGGQTVLLVEQNARMAFGLANRAYVLETGRIVLSGKASELTANEHVKRAYLGL
jgi:branched-chain amino acid transport system ATP-binding protein